MRIIDTYIEQIPGLGYMRFRAVGILEDGSEVVIVEADTESELSDLVTRNVNYDGEGYDGLCGNCADKQEG